MTSCAQKILVTGADGQLGRALQALPPGPSHTTFATHAQLDITQEHALDRWLDEHPADCLINAAAYTAVDRAAQEPDTVFAVNTDAPGTLARACAQRGLRFLHLSTDYVFDGQLTRPYREDDAAAPLNTYGRSKLLGEQAALAENPATIIVRTSWVFSDRAPNFACTVLRLARQRPSLQVVADQIGGPTWAVHLAQALMRLALQPSAQVPAGPYHFSGYPCASRHAFAQEICRQAQACGYLASTPALEAIASSQWPSPEPRPANSCLDTHKLESLLGPLERDWRKGLKAMLSSLQNGRQAR